MQNEEEIRAKLSLDTTSLGRAKREINEFSQHGHSGFVHMTSATKAFHKLMEQLKDVSPGAALALKAVFSPVSAAIAAATTVLMYFNEKLKEMNAEADKAGQRNMLPTGNAFETSRKIGEHQSGTVMEQHQFLTKISEDHDKILDKMKEELGKNKAQHEIDLKRLETHKELSSYAREKSNLELKSAKETLAIQERARAALDAELKTATAMEKATYIQYRSDPAFARSVKASEVAATAKGNVEELNARKRQLQSNIAAGTLRSQLGFTEGIGNIGHMERELSKVNAQLEVAETQYKKSTKQMDEANQEVAKQKGQWSEAKERMSHFNSAVNAITEQINQSRQEVRVAGIQPSDRQPFLPTIESAGQSGGPFSNLANTIQNVRSGVANRFLRGDTQGADALLKRLHGYDVRGYDMPDWSKGGKLRPTYTHVKGLEEQWGEILKALGGNNGIPVNITGVADDPK